MKKIKLFVLTALFAMGTNTFAAVGNEFIGNNGIRYKITKEYVAAAAGVDEQLGTVTVVNYGLSTTSDAVTIPEIVSNQDATNTSVPTSNRYKVVAINGMNSTTADITINGIVVKVGSTATAPAPTGDTQAFKNAESVSITLPTSILYIGESAFEGCKAATIVIPAGSQLAKIDAKAFKNAESLATFATDNATWLAEIGANAFEGCKALTSISLGAKLETIGTGAFLGTGITELDLSTSTKLTAIDRWFTGTADPYKTNTKLTTVKFSATNSATTPLTAIGANAFEGCTALAQIGETAGTAALPAYITTINVGAFLGTQIEVLDVSLCTKLASIAEGSFSSKPASGADLSKLVTVKYPSALATGGTYATIEDGLFQNITTFKNVNADNKVPSYITSIEANAFKGTAIEKLDLSGNNNIADVGDWFSKKPATGADPSTLQQLVLKADKAYTFGTSGTNLANISTLKKVGIPNAEYKLPTNATIKEGMFAGTALEQLDLTNGVTVTTTGQLDALFGANGITSLTSVALPQALTAIAANAFYGCTGLTTLTIKDKTDLSTIVSVGNGAFYRTAIANFDFGAITSALTTLGEMFVITTADKADAAKAALAYSTAESVTINLAKAGITAIPTSAFENVAALTSITLPEGLTDINQSAFAGTGITEITIPASVNAANKILANAFKGCTSLKKLTYMPTATTPANPFNSDAFKDCNLVTIYTTASYIKANPAAPTNTKYADGSSKKFTTVKDKKGNSCFKGFYDEDYDFQFDGNEVANVYEADLDGGDVRMYPMRKRLGNFNVPKGTAVIVKTAEVKEVTPTQITISTTEDALKTSALLGTENVLKSVQTETARTSVPGFGNYMYVFVNPDDVGFTFKFFTGSKINNGNIYVINPKAPETSAARLNVIWYDENGNVEEENTITGISTIEAAAEDGVIYNLAGQQVDANYKGVVVKNGKKVIIK